MTEHAPERIRSGIDIPKTIAGTLAAVSAAVVGSYLGVAGTLVGAAVASIVGSVGTEIYQRWINRGSQKIKSTFVTAPAAVGTPPVAAAEEPPSEELEALPRTIRWGRVAVIAGALFVLAMGLLTAFELITHKTVADAVGNKSGGTTTVSSLWGDEGKKKNNRPAVTPSSSPTEQPSDEPSETPSESPSPATTEPSDTPSSEAPTDAPEQTTPPATDGGGDGDTGGDTSGDGGAGVDQAPTTGGGGTTSGTGSE